MAMQSFGEPAEQRVIRIRRVSLDDQLPACDTERQHRPIDQQCFGTPDDSGDSWFEGRVALRVHRMLVQRDRQLDEKLRQIARQRSPIGPRFECAHRWLRAEPVMRSRSASAAM